jgi:hypothetical protein
MLKLNVGLARKVGEADFGSRGASINLELELDSAVATDAAILKERIRQLFGLVRTSLAEELNGANGHNPASNGEAKPPGSQNGNGNANGNGYGAGPTNGQRSSQRQATQSQVRAIHAIARSRKINVGQLLNDRFQVARAEELSLKQASAVIDELKNDDGRGG